MFSIQELKSSTRKELFSELQKARKELLRIRVGVKTKNVKDSSLVDKQKAYIARLLTVIRELQLEEITQNADKI